jgi:hypothetical protein
MKLDYTSGGIWRRHNLKNTPKRIKEMTQRIFEGTVLEIVRCSVLYAPPSKKKRKLLFPYNFYKNSLKIPDEYSEAVNLKRTDNTMTKEQTTNPTKTLCKVCFHVVISYTRWRVQYRTSNNL